jgi:hypothetical protein
VIQGVANIKKDHSDGGANADQGEDGFNQSHIYSCTAALW